MSKINKKLLIIILLVALMIIFVIVARYNYESKLESGRTVCTQDAKLCEDGSYVSRNADFDCEFNPCPGE
ncbi:hypothetical protein AUJ84_04405 [Candidatus Pacearchaeota archaeon CG1_02_32_132]|nr:MAG: hypothetical protein AUJ84_04405 [Candidatus Pacearchaeota archaeon CG1_02_32_132]